MSCDKHNEYTLPVSQLTPVIPASHVHVYMFTKSLQEPSTHGFPAQSLMSGNNKENNMNIQIDWHA